MTVKSYSRKLSGNVQITPHFKINEFACKDGSDYILIDDKLAQLLEYIRVYFCKPITITSAYRSPTHNKNVGGTANSQHVKGTAADIIVNGVDPMRVAEVAESFLGSSGGIGVYPISKFTHVDVRANVSRWYEVKRGKTTVRGRFKEAAIIEEDNEVVEQSKIIVDNKEVIVKRILKDGVNYIAVRDLAKAIGSEVGAKGNIPVLKTK